jgi:hypothetical protein
MAVLLRAAERQHRAVVVPQVLFHLHPVHSRQCACRFPVSGENRSLILVRAMASSPPKFR